MPLRNDTRKHGIKFKSDIEYPIDQLLIDALDVLPDGFVLLNEKQQLVFCNQRYLEIYAPISQTWKNGTTLSKIAQDTARHCIGINAENEIQTWVEQRLTTWGKSDSWVEQQFQNGHWIRIGETILANGWSVGIRTNITALKNAETQQRESEERFRDFAESGADWFWELNKNLQFHYASDRLEEITGISVQLLIGVSIRKTSLFKDSLKQKDVITLLEHINSGVDFRNLICTLTIDGNNLRVLQLSGKVLFDLNGNFLGYRGAARDITDAHLLSEQLKYDAIHDDLTGLINRKEFLQQLGVALGQSDRYQQHHILCFLDLDHFKLINDTCGHAVGDDFLKQISTTIQTLTRTQDTASRLGGDEFGLLLRNCELDEAMHIAESIRKAIEALPFLWENYTHTVSACIGMVVLNASITSPTHALQSADIACYSAKNRGRNQVCLYKQDDIDVKNRRTDVEWITRIQDAFDNDGFQLFYQPIFPLGINSVQTYNGTDTQHVSHYELLLRMQDESGKITTPSEFLGAVEHFGLSQRLDQWVLETALSWLQENPIHRDDLELCTINISGASLSDERFLNFVTVKLEDNPICAAKLCIEITESAAIRNLEATAQFIKTLKSKGCRFALDDFGKGFSSFSYLKSLPVDILKIDGGFIRDILKSEIDKAVVASVVSIAKELNMQTVAEFVESTEVAKLLTEMNIDYAQGFSIGKPRPLTLMHFKY